MIVKKIILILIIYYSTTMYTLAYIDPGTGSLIIQGIIAIFGAIVVYMGYPIRFIKKIFKSKKEKEKDINQKKL